VWAHRAPSRKKLQAWRDACADPQTKPKPFYRLEAVFDRAQVDSLPPPAEPTPLDPPIAPIVGDTLAWALPELAEAAKAIGVTVNFQALADGHDGFYRPSERRITINDRTSVNQQTTALVHELAHALVDLDHHDDDPDLDYATGELVAESVAHIVCGFLGLDTSANSIPYLAFWSEHSEPDAFERIAALVDRLASRLEEALELGNTASHKRTS
jgi:antirestriction protein ArdC